MTRVTGLRLAAAFFAVGMLALSGCGGGGEANGPPTVERIEVTQPSVTITGIGLSQNVVATPIGTRNQALNNLAVTWSSSNPSVASVSGTTSSAVITATGVGPGGTATATITATAGGQTGQIQVTVIARVNSVTANPSSVALIVNETRSVSATVQADSGIGRNAMWQSLNTAIASIPGGAVASGVSVTVTGVSAGTTVLRAISQADPTKFAEVAVNVTGLPPNALTNLVVSPTPATLAGPGATQVITTTATLSQGASVTYANTSSDPTVATVTPTGPNPTVTAVTPLKLGQATITITANASGPGLTTNQIMRTITVTTPAVATLQVTLGSASLTAGQTTQATATPRDSGGFALTGRGTPTWASNAVTVATVHPTSGLVTGVGPGSTQITASITGMVGTSPTLTVSSPSFVSITPDGYHTCARTSDNLTFCWGRNTAGQLGDGTNADRWIPTQIAGGLAFVEVKSGYFHTCGRLNAGTPYCWGLNDSGDLGDGTLVNKNVPTLVVGGLSFVELSSGGYHSCGRTGTGSTYCWGWNAPGAVGDGTFGGTKTAPALVIGGFTFVELTTGEYHTCGRTAGGAALCWGFNDAGQLGNGTTTNRNSPIAVSGSIAFVEIAAGRRHTCGRTSAGAVYCWGLNGNGELGDGTLVNKLVPTIVSGGLTFAGITANNQTCARTSAGAAYCWGLNSSGQLGDNTNNNRTAPTLVSGGLTFVEIVAALNHTCGRISTGAAYCWGSNQFGQLGDGTTTARTVPTLVK